jgi:hypothetical protein
VAARILVVADEELISRDEVTRTLFAIADINVNVERILRILEGNGYGEEEASEDA